MKKLVLAVAASAALSGCAGATMPAAPALQSNASSAVTFTVRVPRSDALSMRSLVVSSGNAKLGTVDVTPGSKGCASRAGATECSFTLHVREGNVRFSIAAYGGLSGSGALLGGGSVTQAVVGGTTPVVPLTASGVIASIKIALGTSSPPAGRPATTPVYVTAYDASGAAIVGHASYNTPIVLRDSDHSGITTLSTTKISKPGVAVVLSYSGASLSRAKISARAKGVPRKKLRPARLTPVPSIDASYALPAAIAGEIPLAVASGPDKNVWFTACSGSTSYCDGTNGAIVRLALESGAMKAYVSGVTAHLSADAYLGITAGPDGKLWFGENLGQKIGTISTGGRVTEYDAAPLCPNRLVAGPPSDGGVWFTSSCTDSIGHITTGGTVTTYPLAKGGKDYEGIVLGKDGNLYVADKTKGAIGQVKLAGSAVSGYSEVAVPRNPVDGSPNDALAGLVQTADGKLWFSNDQGVPSTIGNVKLATPFKASTVAQYVTKTGDAYPSYLAVTPDGRTLWLAEWGDPIVEEIAPPSGAGAPKLTDFAINASTPSGTPQGLWDIAVGPDGNLWSTVRSAGGTLVRMVY